MVRQTQYIHQSEIVHALELGFSQQPKSLPSWLLYDANGDRIFQQIMRLPSYYPTKCETEILESYKEDLLTYFAAGSKGFNLVELGAGDGTKTDILLKALHQRHLKFRYKPVDISGEALLKLSSRLYSEFPDIDVEPSVANYHDSFDQIKNDQRNIVLFLGANIGNMTISETKYFLEETSSRLAHKDLMLIGFDLKKDPRVIENAYDDPQGVTKEFNLNVLRRLNREAGAEFNLEQFEHYPYYNPETGTASSYLISLKDQDVRIRSLAKTFHFGQWESIHMEISQKYDLLMIDEMLSDAGLEIVDLFFDSSHHFCDVLATKIR